MIAKYAIAGVAGTALLASVAFAQSPPAASDTTKNSPMTTMSDTSTSPSSFQGNWRASKLVGLSVYNEKNENVGSINDLLMDKQGSVKAAVISVGGFLGMGSRLIALPLDKVKFVETPVPSTTTSNAAPPAGTNKPASTTTGSTA